MLLGPVGLPKQDWVTLGLVVLGPMLLVPRLVARFTASPRPLDLYLWCMVPRLLLSVVASAFYYTAPAHFEPSYAFTGKLYLLSLAQVFVSQSMFVAQMAFFTRVLGGLCRRPVVSCAVRLGSG